MHRFFWLPKVVLGSLVLFFGLSTSIAQVKIEDTVRKPAISAPPPPAQAEPKKPSATAPNDANASKTPCDKTPTGCPTSFKPIATMIAPDWYAKQEKDPKEALKSRQKAVAYLEKYQTHAVNRRWELNDIARSYAFFVSLTYNVYSTGNGPSPVEMETMTRRFRAELSKDAKFQANNDRERQFIYERLILVALDNEAGYVFAKQRNDQVSQQKHRERAKLWLEEVIEKPIDKIPNYWK
jgi:hypothetical protein